MTKKRLSVRADTRTRALIDGLCIRFQYTPGEAVAHAVQAFFTSNDLTLERCARLRIENDPDLAPRADALLADVPNWNEHIEWLVTAPTAELLEEADAKRPV